MPNLSEYIKEEDNTVIYSIEKPASKQLRLRKNTNSIKLSFKKINEENNLKSKGKATIDSENIVEFQSDQSFILCPTPNN